MRIDPTCEEGGEWWALNGNWSSGEADPLGSPQELFSLVDPGANNSRRYVVYVNATSTYVDENGNNATCIDVESGDPSATTLVTQRHMNVPNHDVVGEPDEGNPLYNDYFSNRPHTDGHVFQCNFIPPSPPPPEGGWEEPPSPPYITHQIVVASTMSIGSGLIFCCVSLCASCGFCFGMHRKYGKGRNKWFGRRWNAIFRADWRQQEHGRERGHHEGQFAPRWHNEPMRAERTRMRVQEATTPVYLVPDPRVGFSFANMVPRANQKYNMVQNNAPAYV